jgi:hypothetical protein
MHYCKEKISGGCVEALTKGRGDMMLISGAFMQVSGNIPCCY